MSHLQRPLSAWLPITKKEVEDRGWGELDVILITGDAYIDHPAFGAAVIGRIIQSEGFTIAIIGLVMMAVATVFSFITLPVEYDASNRALAWLKTNNMLTNSEQDGAKDSLKWAARTYLVSALGSLAMLLYWGMQILGSRD